MLRSSSGTNYVLKIISMKMLTNMPDSRTDAGDDNKHSADEAEGLKNYHRIFQWLSARRRNSTANALELHLSRTNPSIQSKCHETQITSCTLQFKVICLMEPDIITQNLRQIFGIFQQSVITLFVRKTHTCHGIYQSTCKCTKLINKNGTRHSPTILFKYINIHIHTHIWEC